MNLDILSFIVPVILATLAQLTKTLMDRKTDQSSASKVEEAEKQAFSIPNTVINRIEELTESQLGLEEKTSQIQLLIDSNRQALILGNMFNLYNKQIERYQEETRNRASWSFYIALIAMFFGFAFVFWGGQHILTQTNWDHLAAGSAIAAIGGSISAYITKTFLDVHKLSLQQLNRYFNQPVINDNILMAQRLADNLGSDDAKQKAYENIIASVTKLIDRRSNDSEAVLPLLPKTAD